MKNEDAQLVNQFLTGNENAFTTLVKKYQKSVHALAWRKIGDFHIAEELTQDTFLKAYQKLATLKNPNQFAGWLYVIADRICIDWHRKQKTPMEYLETTSGEEIEGSSYRHYEDEQREEASAEHQRRRVRNLLEKLPESERTVVTLHYLGEMTSKAIGEFLGVSPNTVKSRLQRARNRLKEQENMIQEVLGSVHLPTNFTENIIRQVADIKPVSPTSSSPLVPWAITAATAIFIFLIMGVGSQYLARFQKPYNLNAQSEITIEIIDAPIVLDSQAKPDLRNQAGRFENTDKRGSTGPQLSEPVVLGAARVETETRPSTQQQWIQASGPAGASVLGLQVSATGDIYAASSIGIYKLTPNASTWALINASVPITGNTPMAERGDTLYLVSSNKVIASTDRGESWKSLGERPKGHAVGLVITDDGRYLALDNQVFRSTDADKQWTLLVDNVEGRIILAIAAVKNTVFVGTTQGLYRLHAGALEKLPVDTTNAIHSLAVSENNLYVGTGPDVYQLTTAEGRAAYMRQFMSGNNSQAWELFHSTDLGNSWTEITPTGNSFIMKMSPGIKVLAAGDTVLALGLMGTFRSMDGGNTWTELGTDTLDLNSIMNSMMASIFPAVVSDENTLFKAGFFGPTRSTDGGESWHPFMKGMVGTRIYNLIAFKNALYTNTGTSIIRSTDGGESWKSLRLDSGDPTPKSEKEVIPKDLLVSSKSVISDDIFYGIAAKEENELLIFHLSANGSIFVPIQGVPPFRDDLSIEKLKGVSQKAPKENIADDTSGDDEKTDDFTDIAQQMDPMQHLEKYPSGFAVSGETFYVEYKRRLFRWKRGESEWFNTGLIDMAGLPKDIESLGDNMENLKLAVSDETVYVGKRDGHLFRSFDGGNTWKDLTSNLPLRFAHINEIVFAGSTAYVATNAGVLTSADGEHWGVITDKTGVNTVIDRMTVADTTVYGVGSGGAHLLDKRGEWEKISPEVPDSIISATINGDRLYVATKKRGMFHIPLENENN